MVIFLLFFWILSGPIFFCRVKLFLKYFRRPGLLALQIIILTPLYWFYQFNASVLIFVLIIIP